MNLFYFLRFVKFVEFCLKVGSGLGVHRRKWLILMKHVPLLALSTLVDMKGVYTFI